MSFAHNLEFLLTLNGLTKYKLAKDLKIHQTSITNWIEKGIRPQKKIKNEIANYFGVTVEQLDSDDISLNIQQNEKIPTDTGEDVNNEVMRLYNLLPKDEQEAYLNYLQTRVNILGLNNDRK